MARFFFVFLKKHCYMDKFMVLDEKTKAKLGVLCLIPFAYFLALVMLLNSGHPVVGSVVTITSRHYDILFLMLASSAIITAPVFIYCLVILARMNNLNSAVKTQWVIFLSVLCPVASALFWIFMIKDAPKYLGVHEDIA
jgi:hypothetical protein